MARQRTITACLQAADADLLAFAFRTDEPVFRMGFDHHVRTWKNAMCRETWVRYHTVPAFRQSYDERQQAARSITLPEWGVAA